VLLVAAVVCSTGASAPPQVPAFDHVVVVVLENKERGKVLGNPNAPAFNAFARNGAVLNGYRGVTHPSLPNYLALVSGSTHGISSDCTSCTVGGRSLADTLEARKLTWKAYAEGLPRTGWTGPSRGRYAKSTCRSSTSGASSHGRHAYAGSCRWRSSRATGSPAACPTLRSSSRISATTCTTARSRRGRLAKAFPAAAAGPSRHGGLRRLRRVRHAGPGVPALALGSLVRAHSYSTGVTSHYGLLRTIEQGFGLPLLGRSARATPVTGIWRLPAG
jgi:hypothetical protein